MEATVGRVLPHVVSLQLSGGLSAISRAGDGPPHAPGSKPPSDAFSPSRRHLVVILAVVASLFVVLGHSAMMHSESHELHQPHALLSSVGGESAVNTDHAHLVDGSLTECHDLFATAVLPRPANTLIGLAVVAAMVAVTAGLPDLVVSAGRGPPGLIGPALTGRDLLTRFCLLRR